MRDPSMAQGNIQSTSWESSARQKPQGPHWPRDNFKFSRLSTLFDGQGYRLSAAETPTRPCSVICSAICLDAPQYLLDLHFCKTKNSNHDQINRNNVVQQSWDH